MANYEKDSNSYENEREQTLQEILMQEADAKVVDEENVFLFGNVPQHEEVKKEIEKELEDDGFEL